MPRKKRPREWFKLYANTRHVFESLPSETVGEAVIYALRYFDLGEEPPDSISPMARVAFNVLHSAADEAIADYEEAVEYGRKGAETRRAHADEQESPGNTG